jgi:hypothetical protein
MALAQGGGRGGGYPSKVDRKDTYPPTGPYNTLMLREFLNGIVPNSKGGHRISKILMIVH